MAFVTGQIASNSTGSAAATTIAVTLTGVTAGNHLALVVGGFNQSTTISIADNRTNGWNTGHTLSDAGDTWQQRTFYAANVAAGDTVITATFGASVAYRCICVVEHSGLGSLEDARGLRTTSGTTRNAGSGGYTNTADGELVAFGFGYNWVATPTVGAGFAARTAQWTFNGEAGQAALLVESATYTGSASRLATFGMNNVEVGYCQQMYFANAGVGGTTGRGRLIGGKLVGGTLVRMLD